MLKYDYYSSRPLSQLFEERYNIEAWVDIIITISTQASTLLHFFVLTAAEFGKGFW